MKEVIGKILSWDGASKEGVIEDSNGARYPFTSKEWTEEEPPEVHDGVLVICQNGRDASHVEYLGIEHIPFMKITTYSEQGELRTRDHSRFIGGPWRIRSDALVWMAVAKGLHEQSSHLAIGDLSELLRGEHHLISLRGSVIKYCYGISIELYLKWILIEAKIKGIIYLTAQPVAVRIGLYSETGVNPNGRQRRNHHQRIPVLQELPR